MNKLKELLEKRASLLAEINELSKPGVQNLDADKRAALNGKLDEIARLDSDIQAERQIETLNSQPGFAIPKDKGNRRYSLANVVRAMMGENVDVGYEREVSQEIAKRSGLAASGILIPVDMRANEGTTTTAPAAIGTTVGEYGMALYPRTVLDKLGVRVLAGLSRKTFLSQQCEKPPKRKAQTLAANLVALQNGADILRVHDVKETRKIINFWQELQNTK